MCFLDTEFIEDGRTIDLISLAIARGDGPTLYLESVEVDLAGANDFVRKHVIPQLLFSSTPAPTRWQAQDGSVSGRVTRADMGEMIRAFVGPSPEFWADYGSYDWIALCQLFGPMSALPPGWPMFVRDLQQAIQHYRFPCELLLPAPADAHHALADARWLRSAHLQILDWWLNAKPPITGVAP